MDGPSLISAECAGPPPPRTTVYSRTLQRACEIVGGVDLLARHLRVAPGDLVCWIDGRAKPPMDVFLAAVDVVLKRI